MKTINFPANRAHVARRFHFPIVVLRAIILVRNHVKSNAELFSLFVAFIGVMFLKSAPVFGLLVLVCAVGMSVSYRNRKEAAKCVKHQ